MVKCNQLTLLPFKGLNDCINQISEKVAYLGSNASQIVIMSHDTLGTRRLVLKHTMLMFKVV